MRGIKLATGDEVISLSVLRHVDARVEERAAYLQAAPRRGGGEDEDARPRPMRSRSCQTSLWHRRRASPSCEDAEEMLLTVTNGGFGKRSSAYEYRVTGRGGQGIANITLAPRNGSAVVATFPVRPGDDVMLVTDAGRLIRVPADQVRITGRAAMGVTLFRLG